MIIPPVYKITPKILKRLSQIESLRLLFKSFPVAPEIKSKIERISLLKSSLYSARIEGNPLTLEQVKSPEQVYDRQKKLEVFNILEAIKSLEKEVEPGKTLDEGFILSVHKVVMKELTGSAGSFRTEPGAIFDQAGNAVYIAPLPGKIRELITGFLDYSNKRSDYPVIQAVLAHLIFEKIHPFPDGNGRVGRLLIWAILKAKSYDFSVFVPIEEYIDQNRDRYYFHLDQGLKKTQEYLQFMLDAFIAQSEKIKDEILIETQKKEKIYLPLRQEEILAIIKDHLNVSFNFIRRRFLLVPARTLRYDLKKLTEKGLIIKVGKTRGSFYRIK